MQTELADMSNSCFYKVLSVHSTQRSVADYTVQCRSDSPSFRSVMKVTSRSAAASIKRGRHQLCRSDRLTQSALCLRLSSGSIAGTLTQPGRSRSNSSHHVHMSTERADQSFSMKDAVGRVDMDD